MGETGELIDRLWGRELELKFQLQPKWQSLTASVKVPTAGEAGNGEILLNSVQNRHRSGSSVQQVLPGLPDVLLGIPALSSPQTITSVSSPDEHLLSLQVSDRTPPLLETSPKTPQPDARNCLIAYGPIQS